MDQSNILLEERTLGKKYYELTDHLGNVLATVMDRRTGGGSSGVGTLYSHWKADIATATDYYPGGMMMHGRYKSMNNDTSVYRFGFNGIEKANEVAGVGNHYTALFGEYSPREVHRWNTDPKPIASESPYAMFRGNPIWYVDPLLDYSRAGAWWRNIRDGGGGIYETKKGNGDWGYNTINAEGAVVGHFGKLKSGKTFSEKMWDLDYKANRWMEKNVAPALYKVGAEYNPLSQATTNLGSSITGRDMTIPSLSEARKNGGNVSGEELSLSRRVTTGVVGVTGLAGIGLGGGGGFIMDWGLNAAGDGANQIANSENAGPGLKYGYNFIKLVQAAKNKDVGGVIEESIGITNTASGQVDNALKDEKK